jgi:hypothetical protein
MNMKKEMMRKMLAAGSMMILYVFLVQANIVEVQKDPVKWEFKATRNGMDAELLFKASIEKTWHLYSTVTPEGGPVPTAFNFKTDNSYKLNGKIIEPAPVSKYDSSFDMQIKYFSNEVIFRQKIKLNTKSSSTITGTVTYMVCDDQKCLPPKDVEFKIVVPAVQ